MDPVSLGLLLGGTALAGGGSLFDTGQSASRVNAQRAIRDALVQQEMQRNYALANESQGFFNKQFDTMTPEAQAAQRDAATTNRVAAGAAPTTIQTSVGRGVNGGVNDEVGRLAKVASDRVAHVGAAKAKLAGYGDTQGNIDIGLRGASDKIGTMSNFAAGNARAFPAELQAGDFNAAKDFNSPLGGIMKAAGSLAGLGGAMMPAGGFGVPSGVADWGAAQNPMGIGMNGTGGGGVISRIGDTLSGFFGRRPGA